jgi:hypothetical protein
MDDFFDYLKWPIFLLSLGLLIFNVHSILGASGERVSDADLCRFRLGETTTGQLLSTLGKPVSNSTAGGADNPVALLTYEYKDLDVKEVTIFSFERNVLREVSATAGVRFEDPLRARVLPACLTSALGPGPWEAYGD